MSIELNHHRSSVEDRVTVAVIVGSGLSRRSISSTSIYSITYPLVYECTPTILLDLPMSQRP